MQWKTINNPPSFFKVIIIAPIKGMLIMVETIDPDLVASSMEIQKILKSAFGLTKKQSECLYKLYEMEGKSTCIMNLVDKLESERSLIQKTLKVLHELGFVERKQVTLAEFQNLCLKNKHEDMSPNTNRGYLYVYTPIPKDNILQKLTNITESWQDQLGKFLQKTL